MIDDGRRMDADEDPMELPSQAVAIEEAHQALRDMAHGYLHHRSRPVLRCSMKRG